MSQRKYFTRDEIKLIYNALRQATLKWEGRAIALKKARKQVVEDGKKKFYWQCAICKFWFRNSKEVEVDHKVEIGGYQGSWEKVIGSMFCEPETDLQVLCVKCHQAKTTSAASERWARKKPSV